MKTTQQTDWSVTDDQPHNQVLHDQPIETEIAETENSFEPLPIGEPDEKRATVIKLAWEHLAESATTLKKEVEKILQTSLTIDEFLNFAKCNDPKKWILGKYITDHQISYPGLSMQKIIEANFIDLDVSPVLPHFANFRANFEKVKETKFFVPLRECWYEDEQIFMAADWEQIDNFCSRFTSTPEQNEILKTIETLVQCLNTLAEKNILRPKNGPDELNFMSDFVKIGQYSRQPVFVVNNALFRTHRLSGYNLKNTRNLMGSFDVVFV